MGLSDDRPVESAGAVALPALEFPSPPTVPLWRTAVKRGTGVPVLPRIEARAARLGAVGPEELRAYAATCGVPSPAGTLPPCFPDRLCRGLQLAVLTSPAFPVKLLGIVHVRQSIRQRRAIRADEPLSGSVHVEGFRSVRRGGEFDVHSVVRTPAGEALWHGVTTILSPDLPQGPLAAKRPDEGAIAFTPTRSTCWTLPEDLGRRYARVSGDVNPIHQYAWAARLFGFKRAIIHGWWSLARGLAELDLDPAAGLAVDAQFKSPIFLPGQAWFASGPAGSEQVFEVRSGGRLALTARVSAGVDGGNP